MSLDSRFGMAQNEDSGDSPDTRSELLAIRNPVT